MIRRVKLSTRFDITQVLQAFIHNSSCYSTLSNENQSYTSKFAPAIVNKHFSYRTHTCEELRASDEGKTIKLYGWLQFRRGNFLVIRDSYGMTQCMLTNTEHKKLLKKLSLESVIQIGGIVARRPMDMINSKMNTGEIEIMTTNFAVINRVEERIEIQIEREDVDVKDDELRMRARYVDLRRNYMQEALRLRSSLTHSIRRYLVECANFVEVETPTFFRRTPGGASEFIVPTSSNPGHVYSLPQSPQQFKQLLMVGGLDRYFQFARCYRDEKLTTERQPEFTQLDVEMSFANAEQVMHLVESVLSAVWPVDACERDLLPRPDFSSSIPRIRYADALKYYGVDKPDLRFEMRLKDIDNIKHGPNAIAIDYSLPKTIIKDILLKIKSEISKRPYNSELNIVDEDNRYFLIVTNQNADSCRRCAGQTRILLAQFLQQEGIKVQTTDTSLLWVVDFPLFELVDGRLQSVHHPFTAAIEEHNHLLALEHQKSWTTIIGQHYDLVLNGVELGGGSVRIHEQTVQKFILDNVLHIDAKQEFNHLIKALGSGAPPHAGFALGYDRWNLRRFIYCRFLALLLKRPTIRDVIAFPKAGNGVDLMSRAPCKPLNEELDRYSFRFIVNE